MRVEWEEQKFNAGGEEGSGITWITQVVEALNRQDLEKPQKLENARCTLGTLCNWACLELGLHVNQ